MKNRFLLAGAVCALLITSSASATNSCGCTSSATFNSDGTSVYVQTNKELDTVVLKYCDGSPSKKFDHLSGKSKTFSAGSKQLSGVWVKSSCGESQYVGRSCSNPTPTPTPKCTPTPTPTPKCTPTKTPTSTPTPTVTPTPSLVKICHIPNGVSSAAYTINIPQSELATHLAHGDALGDCPVDCMNLPFGQAVIDQCGICGGDSSTCKDCAGVINGPAKMDACGVCNGNGSTCAGCDGVPNSGKVLDVCGQCGGDGSSCKDCLGVPNGGAVVDQCGKCAGNNDTCTDCMGVPNGTAKINACGNCGGDEAEICGNGCNGTMDKCGVCNGTNACLDCAGIPNGGTAIDCCGVCGGDGSTCVEQCTFYDLTVEKRKTQRNIKLLLNSVVKYSNAELKCLKGKSKKVPARITLAKKLAAQTSEILGGVISDKIKVCDTPFCSKTSYVDVLVQLQGNTKRIYKLSRQAQYGAGKACGKTGSSETPRLAHALFTNTSGGLKKFPSVKCNN